MIDLSGNRATDREGRKERGFLSTLQGLGAVMDTAVVITQRLLLPTLPHLRPNIPQQLRRATTASNNRQDTEESPSDL